jgi:hypothetical protein
MIECNQDTVEDTYQVLKNNFGAKYVLVGKLDNPDFDVFLRNDPRFELGFDSEREAIYLIK